MSRIVDHYCGNCGVGGKRRREMLKTCGGCLSELYCVSPLRCSSLGHSRFNIPPQSKDEKCAREAWPNHKTTCARLQQRTVIGKENFEALRLFSHTHRASIIRAAIRALDIAINPSRSRQYILIISVKKRPGSHPIKSSFTFDSAIVFPLEGGCMEGFQDYVVDANEAAVRDGALGAVVAITKETPEPEQMDKLEAVPFTVVERSDFGDGVRVFRPFSIHWRNELKQNLDNGV
jgi:hypothetical protein